MGHGLVYCCVFILAAFPAFWVLGTAQGTVFDSPLFSSPLSGGVSLSPHRFANIFQNYLKFQVPVVSCLLSISRHILYLKLSTPGLISSSPRCNPCPTPNCFVVPSPRFLKLEILTQSFISLLYFPYHVAAIPGTYIYVLCNIGQVT